MESRQPTPINGRLNQQYRREAAVRKSSKSGVRRKADFVLCSKVA
jgi:hypothetical protein